jgi:hypothetical protein
MKDLKELYSTEEGQAVKEQMTLWQMEIGKYFWF